MKVIGVGLNKTGTKTLRACLIELGYRHITYDFEAFRLYRNRDFGALRRMAEQYDSCEDWPWPLLYREFDQWFPDAKFILTVRKSPEHWFRSLCKMSVRLGPMNDFDKHVYGYGMPHGRQDEYIQFYNNHNESVQAYFRDRPDKLLTVCWGNGDGWEQIADFLGYPIPEGELPSENITRRYVYGGDNLVAAQLYRLMFQSARRVKHWVGGESGRFPNKLSG